MDAPLLFSLHSRIRMAQRGITLDEVDYVVDHGTPVPCYGAARFLLRQRDVPAEDLPRMGRLVGTTVVVSLWDLASVITAYRSRPGARHAHKLERQNSGRKSRQKAFEPF